MAKVNPVPEGLRTLTPQLIVDGANQAIEFYQKAFGAELVSKAPDPTGKKVWHAHLRIGDSAFFLNDAMPEMGAPAQQSSLWVYRADVDAAYQRAVDAGATSVMSPADMFWGDRICQVVDRWGNKWNLAMHVKDMTEEEMRKAGEAFAASSRPQ